MRLSKRLANALGAIIMLRPGPGQGTRIGILHPTDLGPDGKPREKVLVTLPNGTSKWLPVLSG